jgi:DNA-binding CsgD family transcriptional regulator
MQKKTINKVNDEDFSKIYDNIPNKQPLDWKIIFKETIEQFSSFTFTKSFWYIADFNSSQIVSVGGDYKQGSPLAKKDWIGLHALEMGKLFHPLDVSKMMSFIVFVAQYLSNKTDIERNNSKFSLVFRMLDDKNKYTWRILTYPKLKYVNNTPYYLMCAISDFNHILSSPKCSLFLLDKNTKDETLFYCEEETVKLIPFKDQKELSLRELDVLKLLAKGLISKEIAEVLKISKNTVENHKQNIYTKTGTRNIAELVSFMHKSEY